MEKTRRQIADEALEYISNFLERAGWRIDCHTLFWIDPVTDAKYSSDTAFSVQIARDLN